MRIRELDEADWPGVASIYAAGIATGNATFETEVPGWDEWAASHPEHGLVGDDDGRVVGWAALTRPVSPRACYRGVVEDSVYVEPDAQGRGIGRALLDALIRRAEAAGLWTIQTSIFPENEASLALHRACGFRVVGVRERIAQLHGAWRDTVLLERRSTTP